MLILKICLKYKPFIVLPKSNHYVTIPNRLLNFNYLTLNYKKIIFLECDSNVNLYLSRY